MLTYPEIDPVAIAIGPVAIRWYGIAYIVGIGIGWWLGRRRAARDPWRGWTPQHVDDFVFFLALGAVLGGRVGYVLFYDFSRFVSDPLVVVRIWEGGMSFHGGLLGVIAATAWFARRHGFGFFAVADYLAPLVPPGLGAGRIGNFVNGELWGKPAEVPWAMVFPGAGPEARHPSQLYEAALEGLALFVVLWWFSRRPGRRWPCPGCSCWATGRAVSRRARPRARRAHWLPRPRLGDHRPAPLGADGPRGGGDGVVGEARERGTMRQYPDPLARGRREGVERGGSRADGAAAQPRAVRIPCHERTALLPALSAERDPLLRRAVPFRAPNPRRVRIPIRTGSRGMACFETGVRPVPREALRSESRRGRKR